MEFYRKKNDTSSRPSVEKPETTELKINRPRKFSKRERRIRKKENREKHKAKLQELRLVGKFGDVYIWCAMDPENKYLFPDVVGTRGRVYGKELIQTVQAMRLNATDKLLFQSDNYDVYTGIIKECFSEEVYSYFNNRENDRIPKEAKMPDHILYTVVNKTRNSQGEIEEISASIVFGDPADILSILKNHNPTQGINTSYIERQNLSKRHFNARLRRKSPAFSKDYECLVAQLALQRMYANCCWAHTTLSKQQKKPTSPAMAIGKLDHVLTMKELLMTRIINNL